MSDTERRVRERAYQLWEEAGRPHERNEEFWYRARQEIEDQIPDWGDGPAGTTDFPPNERSVEDPPELAVDTGMPFDVSEEQTELSRQPAAPTEAEATIARMAVPEIHPLEPDAAEATVPHEPAPAESEPRPSRSVATSAARKAAEVAEEAVSSRRPRTGAARPPSSRPAPSRPGRK